MNRLSLVLLLALFVAGCGSGWSDKRGWEGFIQDLETRGLKGNVVVIPPSPQGLHATNITYTIDAGNQNTQMVTILEFEVLDEAYRYSEMLKTGEQTNFVSQNCNFVVTCNFQPPDTNRAGEVRKILMHHRRARLTETK